MAIQQVGNCLVYQRPDGLWEATATDEDWSAQAASEHELARTIGAHQREKAGKPASGGQIIGPKASR